jgi:segregation and condensation protein B
MAKKGKQPGVPVEAAIKPQQNPRVRVVRMEESPEEAAPSVDDSGLSLEDLGQAYAALLNRGSIPYDTIAPEEQAVEEASAPPAEASRDPLLEEIVPFEPEPSPESDAHCAISPKSILEAILFVGHPQNEPLTAKQVALLMRGVLPEEIDELVKELNDQYAAECCPYWIASEGAGYRLSLREEFNALREQFYGRVKEARLSQAAVDTLAIVAYHQPVTQKQIDEFRSKPSGGILSQLVRRQLIKIERLPERPKELLYRTTARFLDLFGLESLDDLPRGHDIDTLG